MSVKKRLLCVFLLLAYLLVSCTILSLKIEKLMTNQVYIIRLPDFQLDIPAEARIPEEDGMTYVYEAVDGIGWEYGFRARKADPNFAQVDTHNIILYGTHNPVDGELVNRVVDFNEAPDQYLAVYDCPPWEYEELPQGFGMIAEKDNVQLFRVDEAPQPFMERRAKWTLLPNMELPWSVYSIKEAEDFLSQLPLLAVLAVVLAVPAVLWLGACFLLRGMNRRRDWLFWNVGASAAGVVGLAVILAQIDLPGSMLPADIIVDFAACSQRVTTLMDGLKALGPAGQETLDLAERMLSQGRIILIAGLALCVLLVIAQQVLLRRSIRKDS